MSLPAYRDPSQTEDARIADLLGRMTPAEKVAQLHCHGRWDRAGGLFDDNGRFVPAVARERLAHGMSQFGRLGQRLAARPAAEAANALQQFLADETRLGIPALINHEGLHGLMATGATSFPQAIALACTWNETLVEQVYTVVARETRARGGNYIYTPVLDLARDARWGRVEETFGEDPHLVGRLGVAAIRGLQGANRPLDPDRVLACAKHFAVHGQPEGGLNAAPNNISERTIREEFLPPFAAAVREADVQAVMAAYNEVDGIPVHVNPWLLQTILREEWGFDGFVTSDGIGVPQLIRLHRVAADAADAARQALLAGVDNEVPLGLCYPTLLEQMAEDEAIAAAVDRSVANVLRVKLRLGLLDATPRVDPDAAEQITNCAEHRALALTAAQQAMVLLKNDGLLPLDLRRLSRIAVIGPNAADLHLGGYSEDPQTGRSVLDGIRAYVGERAEVVYAEGCRITEGPQGYMAWHADEVRLSDPADDDDRIAAAVAAAEAADVAILVIGGNEATCREGWWFDHIGDRASLALLGRQDELVAAVAATGTPIVVLLINGRPLAIGDVVNQVSAVVECWYLGQATGDATAGVLFGDVNPSGKLPLSFPHDAGQLPVHYYHKPSAKRGYLFRPTEPLFPFGFGLSYTTFAYGAPRLAADTIAIDESTTLSVDVTNTGAREGVETVQLYVHDRVSSVTRPVKLLKGFRRLSLAPGETRTVTFEITPVMLAFLDREMRLRVEPGMFDLLVGPNSADLQAVALTGVARPRIP